MRVFVLLSLLVIWISYITWQGMSIKRDIDEIKTIVNSSNCGAQSAEIQRVLRNELSDMKKTIAELSNSIKALEKQ